LYTREELREDLFFTIKIQIYNFIIVPNSEIIICISILFLKFASLLVTYKIFYKVNEGREFILFIKRGYLFL